MTSEPDRFGPVSLPDLARAAIDELDAGLFVCDAGLRQVRWANAPARRLLTAYGGSAKEIPRRLRFAIKRRAYLDLSPERFSASFVAPPLDGRRVLLRVKHLTGPGANLLVVITELKDRDERKPPPLERLRGLPPRLGQLVTLLYGGHTLDEAAAVLGLSPKQAAAQLAAIRQALQADPLKLLARLDERVRDWNKKERAAGALGPPPPR